MTCFEVWDGASASLVSVCDTEEEANRIAAEQNDANPPDPSRGMAGFFVVEVEDTRLREHLQRKWRR